MRSTRRSRRAVLIAVFTVALLAFNTTAVFAHYTEAWHGSDKAFIFASHDELNVQDGECDGNYVYAQGYWWNPTISSNILVTVWDTNGCSFGFEWARGTDFHTYRVCEQNVGCSAWRGA